MKKLLAVLLTAAMVLSLAACGGKQESTPAPTEVPTTEEPTTPEPTVDPDTLRAADTWQYDNSKYYQDSEKIYDSILGDYLEYYEKATEISGTAGLSERWALEAIAEAKLLNAAIMLPTFTSGGGYAIGRVVPRTAPTTLWGNDSARLRSLLVVGNDFLTRTDSNVIKAKWAELKGTGTFTAWVENYLKEQGYVLQNTYSCAYTEDPQTWDALNTGRAADTAPAVMTLDGLMEYDIENVQKPALALSVEANDDNTVFTFKLREGVKWYTADGKEYAEVTADDFVAGLQHALDAKGGAEKLAGNGGVRIVKAEAYIGGEVADFAEVGVKALDKYTLQYTLEEPCVWFTTVLGCNLFLPMNRAYYESQGGKFGAEYSTEDPACLYGRDPEHIAYCGPYLVSEWAGKKTIVFEANPNYWNKDAVRLKTVTWIFSDGSDELQDYTMTKFGKLDGCSLNAAAVKEARADDLFEKYAYISDTGAVSRAAFFNVMRNQFVNVNDADAGVSEKTVGQAKVCSAFMQNIHFRHALATAVDRSACSALTAGEELKYSSLRNSCVPGNFVQLPEDVTVEINGKAVTFPAGTYYGEIVQAQIDADGFAVTVWDPAADNGIGSGDGFDGWYDPEYSFSEFETAMEELKAQGIEISADDPIVIEIPYAGDNALRTDIVNTVRESIEAAFKEYVKVVPVDCKDTMGWLYAGFYPDFGYEMNADITDTASLSPYCGDPQTYLNAMTPFTGGLLKFSGIY